MSILDFYFYLLFDVFVLYVLFCFSMCCLIQSHLFAKVMVLIRAFDKQHKKQIKSVVPCLTIKNFRGRGRLERQHLWFWLRSLAGRLKGSRNHRFWLPKSFQAIDLHCVWRMSLRVYVLYRCCMCLLFVFWYIRI